MGLTIFNQPYVMPTQRWDLQILISHIELRTSCDSVCLHHHVGSPWVKMNGASADLRLSEFTSQVKAQEIERYIAKLDRLIIAEPYNAPGCFSGVLRQPEQTIFKYCSILTSTITWSTVPRPTPEIPWKLTRAWRGTNGYNLAALHITVPRPSFGMFQDSIKRSPLHVPSCRDCVMSATGALFHHIYST